MPLSMTGFGRALVNQYQSSLSMELRSVNSRYFDLTIRSPRLLSSLEAGWRQQIQEEISRGKLELRVTYQDLSGASLNITSDLARARAYAQAYRDIAQALGEDPPDNLAMRVAQLPDVICLEEEAADEESLARISQACLADCLADFHKMRSQEGGNLAQGLLQGLDRMEILRGQLLQKAAGVTDRYRDRLLARVEELLGLAQEEFYDGQRVAAEIAIFADKADITEELTRLASHFQQFQLILAGEGALGKKLDFLIQEMNRESNTIASKSQDLEMTKLAVELKSEIEQVREQIQNLE
ncbi:MAG: YicC/YloC family endoribonuclease [Eubacteriales bacterium]|nr:YicC family protein [Clostridiales bacterium]MDY5835912.1 YicC/YloC family endoribonuclease [Eubacteriales bacterium]